MKRALRLARRGLYSASPNPRVGCVLSKNGGVVGQGWHQRAGTEHAEIHALREAGEQARDATAHITLEPCVHHNKTPPCTSALIEAGVSRVHVAMEDPNPLVAGRGIQALREAGVRVEVGLLREQALALNPGFTKRMATGLPWLCCKLAASLDGRTAMASGQSRWITSPAARRDVQKLRARSCAILCGVNTVLQDDPRLGVRGALERAISSQPYRVVLDSQLRTPPQAQLLQAPGSAILCTTEAAPRGKTFPAPTEVVRLPATPEGRVDALEVLRLLGQRECNEVLLESGPTLAGALLRAGLIDEFYLYLAPKILGSQAQPLLQLPLERLEEHIGVEIRQLRRCGEDLCIHAIPRKPCSPA